MAGSASFPQSGTPSGFFRWCSPICPGRRNGSGFSRPGRAGQPGAGRIERCSSQSKRRCDSRGKGGPRQVLVRTAARSKAGGLPQTVAPIVTLSAGRFYRQRRVSRLDRRMGFVSGRAAAFVLRPDDPRRGLFVRCHAAATPFRINPAARGFFSSMAGPASFPQRGTPSGFSRWRYPTRPERRNGSGFFQPGGPGSSPFRRGDSLDHRRGPNQPRAWWPLFHPPDEASAWMIPSRRRGPNRLW